jgi:organic radical activating enzyme
MLQVDQDLIDALHARGFSIAIETNGTLAVPEDIDWVCVSPKAGQPLVQQWGDELKLVYPQAGVDPAQYLDLEFEHRFLQPMDGPARASNTEAAIAYCKANPPWRLSVQTHKILGIP